MYSTSTISVI